MQNMDYYYDFSGQKFGYPLSLSINSFERMVFSCIKSLKICYVLKGEYEVICEHFSGCLKEHEVVVIMPEEIHKISKHTDEESVILTIHIDFSKLPLAMVGDVRESFVSMFCTQSHHPQLLASFRKCLSQLVTLLSEKNYNLFELNKLMMELMSLASNFKDYPIEKLPLISEHNENYMKTIQYINSHYQENIHLEDIAKTLNFSISYTSKLFKKYTQLPFVKYLSYVRLRSSLEALLEGKKSIEQIASECGMPNTKAYTTAFKDLYGILPSAYRKQFIGNMKYNEEHLNQEMVLEEKQLSLLAHLLAKDEPLYEDEKLRLMSRENSYWAEIKQDEFEISIKDSTVKLYVK